MIRLLCAVAAVALVAPTVATAQQSRHDNNRHDTNRDDNNRHDNNRNDNNRHDNNRSDSNRHDSNRHDNNRSDNNWHHQSGRHYGTYRVGHRPTTYRRMNASSYHYPRGYSYRRWSAGAILPSLFLSNSYYFNNYGSLGLGAPPPGYVWVRYGPDLLLVNRHNGRIIDVIRGAFY